MSRLFSRGNRLSFEPVRQRVVGSKARIVQAKDGPVLEPAIPGFQNPVYASAWIHRGFLGSIKECPLGSQTKLVLFFRKTHRV
jgi:hypothetical protein